MNVLIMLLLVLVVWWVVLSPNEQRENWGTSPGVYDQLAASSGYYPYWRYGWPYTYGEGRRYRWADYYYPGWGTWSYPRPWGWYY